MTDKPEHQPQDGAEPWAPPADGLTPAAGPPPSLEATPPQAAEKRMERPSPLTGLAKSWLAVFAFIVAFGREFVEGGLDAFREMGPFAITMIIVVAVIAFLTLIWGFIQWRTTRFVADEQEFRIERNFLSRDSRRISYSKIQSVDIQRPFLARILGLAGVSIDAGADESTKLEFLTGTRADALRDHILHNMRSLNATAPTVGEDGQPTDAAPATSAVARPAELLLAVKPGTLILGAVVSNFLPLAIMATIGVIISAISRVGSIALAVPLVIGAVSFLGSQVIAHLNFRIERVPDGLRISRGMLNTSTRSLRADRIQAVAIRQDALQRLTGLYRMNVTVLGGGLLGSDAETTSLVLPYGDRRDVRTVLGAFWPGINIDAIDYEGQPPAARWITPLAFKNHRWGFDQHSIISTRGWLNSETAIVPHRRMQSISVTQGPLQRRLNLTSIQIHTTTGPIAMRVEHMAAAEARAFLDAQVERARIARETPGEPSYLTGFAPPSVADRAPDEPTPPPPWGRPPALSDEPTSAGEGPVAWSRDSNAPAWSAPEEEPALPWPEPPAEAPDFAPPGEPPPSPGPYPPAESEWNPDQR